MESILDTYSFFERHILREPNVAVVTDGVMEWNCIS